MDEFSNECLFYRCDCDKCIHRRDRYECNVGLSILEKANLIYIYLGAVLHNSCNMNVLDKYDMSITSKEYKYIIESVRAFYMRVCRQLGLDKVCIREINDILDKCIELSEL